MSMDNIINSFQKQFGATPAYLTTAPGRVNLIGEHTDYNDGFVLPMAINRYVNIAFSPREDKTIRIFSNHYNELATIDLDNLKNEKQKHWSEYIKGVAWVLKESFGDLKGFDAVLDGNVPKEAGLSSSASVEIAVAKTLSITSNIEWNPKIMAKLCQKAENQWVGVNCGIMDQTIIACGEKNHAVLIDCRDLSTKSVSLPDNIAVVIMDTATRRGLVGSAYNDRRKQCEEVARAMGVYMLRDATIEQLEQLKNQLSEESFRRAKHVISENNRVIQAVKAMAMNDAKQLGEILNAGHESLKSDFEVSSKNLDIIVEYAQNTDGCFGARMTGAGFGGCAVAIVDSEKAEKFAEKVTKEYQEKTGLTPALYITEANDGVKTVKIELL